MLVNWDLITSFPCHDLSLGIWQKINSKCVPLHITLQQVEGWRAKYIFSKCLNLTILEAETEEKICIVEKAKEKLATRQMVQHHLNNPNPINPMNLTPRQMSVENGNFMIAVTIANGMEVKEKIMMSGLIMATWANPKNIYAQVCSQMMSN